LPVRSSSNPWLFSRRMSSAQVTSSHGQTKRSVSSSPLEVTVPDLLCGEPAATSRHLVHCYGSHVGRETYISREWRTRARRLPQSPRPLR
jgi:hypothetical protein